MNGETIRTITIRGQSEGLDKLTADVNKLATAQQNVAIVSEQSAKRVLSLEDAWKRQTMRLDEAARAQANIARETKVANQMLHEQRITTEQHAERLNLINQRYAKTADATKVVTQQTGLARHELVNLGRQAQDVGVSLMSGQSPFTVLVQQGTQIADVFATSGGTMRGFFSQAIGWAKGFFTSTLGIVTAIGAVGAAAVYVASQFKTASTTIEEALEEQNRLMKIGHSLRTTSYLLLNNEIDLQAKLAVEMEKVAKLTERRASTPTSVAGEMGEVPGAFAALPGYEKLIDAVQTLQTAMAQGQPGFQQFNTALSQISASSPGVKAVIDELLKTGEVGVRLEQAAAAAGRLRQLSLELAQVYPGMTFEVAKQLQMQQAQLAVAQARTEGERLVAQYQLDILQGKQQGLKIEEQIALATGKQALAEENIKKAIDAQIQSLQDNLKMIEARKNGTEATVAAEIALRKAREGGATEEQQKRIVDLTKETTDATEDTGTAIQNNTVNLQQFNNVLRDTAAWADKVHAFLGPSLAQQIENRLPEIDFGSSKQYTSMTTFGQEMELQAAINKKLYGEGNYDVVTGFAGDIPITTVQPKQNLSDRLARERMSNLTSSLKDLTSSTDSLNATMQNALSPFYSQDPRTTKLGFRAGTVGNPDWMTGAGNANPLVAVLGAGATAPGMANGGSFVVGGGYSANDNRMAVFPVASGEQVMVNRNPQGRGGQVVNIDNRIIVTGTVDVDALSKMKVSRFQQAQRMRGQLARA